MIGFLNKTTLIIVMLSLLIFVSCSGSSSSSSDDNSIANAVLSSFIDLPAALTGVDTQEGKSVRSYLLNNFTKSYTVPDGVPISDMQWGLAEWWFWARYHIQLSNEFKSDIKNTLQFIFKYPELFENPGMTIQYNGERGAGTIIAEKSRDGYDWKVSLEEGYKEFDSNDPTKEYKRIIVYFSIINDKAKGHAFVDLVKRNNTDVDEDGVSDYYKQYEIEAFFDATSFEKVMEIHIDINLEPLLNWYDEHFAGLDTTKKVKAFIHFMNADPKNLLMKATQNGNDYTLTSSVYFQNWDYLYNDDGNPIYGLPGGDTPFYDKNIQDKRRIFTIRARSDGTVARIDIAFPKQAEDANNIFNVENTPAKVVWNNLDYLNFYNNLLTKAILRIEIDQMFNSAFFTKDKFLGFYDGSKLHKYPGIADIGYIGDIVYYCYDNDWYYYNNDYNNWVQCNQPNLTYWNPSKINIF